MSEKISGFITSKFAEIQSRVPITLAGFSGVNSPSFQKHLDDSLGTVDNAAKEGAATASAASGGAGPSEAVVEISNPVIFPRILPAPPEPEIVQAEEQEESVDASNENRVYGYYDEFGNYQEYSYGDNSLFEGLDNLGNFGNPSEMSNLGNLENLDNLDNNVANVGTGNNVDNNIAYLNRYGDAEIQAKIQEEITLASMRYGVDENLIKAVIMQESSFSPTSLSSAGAQGLMQLMPATSQGLGITNPWDIAQNIDGGSRLLSKYLEDYDGNLKLVLSAYNAGPGAVRKYGGVPPYKETQNYIQKVIAYYNRYHNESSSLYDSSVLDTAVETVTGTAAGSAIGLAPGQVAEQAAGSTSGQTEESAAGQSTMSVIEVVTQLAAG